MTLPAAYAAAAALEQSLGDPRDPDSALSFARAVELDEREEFPERLFDALVSRGYLRQMVPREQSGLFESFESAAALQRAVSRRDLTCAIALGQSFLGSIAVWLAGSPTQRARTAELLLAGESMALALTEEDHGSDVLATETHANKIASASGDGAQTNPLYRISGRKWLINNGTRAQALTLFARTDSEGGLHGHSLFLLEKARVRSGSLTPLKKIRTHGIRGADISGLVLNDVEMDADALLGLEGSGADLLFKCLQITRTGCAAFSLGAADSALRLALDFAQERKLYGSSVIELPHARAELAGAFLDLLLCDAAALVGARAVQAAPEQLSLWSAAIKFFVPVVCEESMRAAARVLGARHYLREQFAHGAFQKLLRDAAVVSLFDGSTAVNLDGIGTQLLRLSPARAASEEEREQTLQLLFAIGAPLPPLDAARLQLMNAGRCDVTQGLPRARLEIIRLCDRSAAGIEQNNRTSIDEEVSQMLPPLVADLEAAIAGLSLEVAALQSRDRAQVKRSPELFAHAERYSSLFAGACAVQLFLRNRGRIDSFFDEGAWVVLVIERALSRASGKRAAVNPLSPRAAARMLELHEGERSFGLVPLPLGRSGKR